jgi:diguanylate cyclase (GGDEF)-like protein
MQRTEHILLQLQRKPERRHLEDMLGNDYHILLPDMANPLEAPFELAILDGPSLRELREKVEQRRREEEPVMLPFLLLTRRDQKRPPARFLGTLVDDLLVRPFDESELRARVANLMRLRRLSLTVKREHDRVMKLAVTDDVTGFNNTRYLHRYLDRFLEAAATRPAEACLVFFDLDNFKSLVDVHGHLAGSKALKEVAQVVHGVLDEDDRVVRYGGDEFIVILPRQSKEQGVRKVETMREAIRRHVFLQKEEINARLTASFGLAAFPQDATDKRTLLAEADRCLFRSKSEGKDRISLPEPPKPT